MKSRLTSMRKRFHSLSLHLHFPCVEMRKCGNTSGMSDNDQRNTRGPEIWLSQTKYRIEKICCRHMSSKITVMVVGEDTKLDGTVEFRKKTKGTLQHACLRILPGITN